MIKSKKQQQPFSNKYLIAFLKSGIVMSSERGNFNRSRAQKHKNTSAFRNNMHDNSAKQKSLNSLTFDDTCDRCSQILQWKVQYRKYKPLNHPKKCTK